MANLERPDRYMPVVRDIKRKGRRSENTDHNRQKKTDCLPSHDIIKEQKELFVNVKF
jgi:hypothetical protein